MRGLSPLSLPSPIPHRPGLCCGALCSPCEVVLGVSEGVACAAAQKDPWPDLVAGFGSVRVDTWFLASGFSSPHPSMGEGHRIIQGPPPPPPHNHHHHHHQQLCSSSACSLPLATAASIMRTTTALPCTAPLLADCPCQDPPIPAVTPTPAFPVPCAAPLELHGPPQQKPELCRGQEAVGPRPTESANRGKRKSKWKRNCAQWSAIKREYAPGKSFGGRVWVFKLQGGGGA